MERIAGALRKKEGFRHTWLGDSRMGKTTANVQLIRWVQQQKLVDVTLHVDDKDRWKAQYEGTYRANPQDLKARPPRMGENPNNIVFRGVAISLDLSNGVEPESVADMAWALVRLKPVSVLVNIDELADATNGHQSWKGESIPQLYRKGGGIGISVVSTTQMPQLLPREAFGLSDTIGIFRLTSREAEYLANYRVIGIEDVETIANLEVGQFILFAKSGNGGNKDNNIYKFQGLK